MSDIAAHDLIRGEFIRGLVRRKATYNDSSWSLISKRNELLVALNRRYGYADADGRFGTGCKSHVDTEYKSEYDAIEAQFRGPYEKQLPAVYSWAKENGMSVFECLLADDINDGHLQSIAERSESVDDWQLNAIMMRARLEVTDLAAKHSIGEVRRLIDDKIANHHYAEKRCRKRLELGPFDISGRKAIWDYRKEWTAALNGAFDQLRSAS